MNWFYTVLVSVQTRFEESNQLPIEVSTCLSSAAAMKPWPSRSKVLKASMKSANVPMSVSELTAL